MVLDKQSDVQGGFTKMSRKGPKMAENKLKMSKNDIFWPKMT